MKTLKKWMICLSWSWHSHDGGRMRQYVKWK